VEIVHFWEDLRACFHQSHHSHYSHWLRLCRAAHSSADIAAKQEYGRRNRRRTQALIENRRTAPDHPAKIKNSDLISPRVSTFASTAISRATGTAAASAAIATVTATATSAAAAIFVTATATSAAKAPLVAGTCFIDAQRASVKLFAIELADGVLRLGFRCHRHKGKSAGLAREFVLHQQHLGHSAGLRKHILQLDLRRRERQVAYVQSISHNVWIFAPEASLSPAGTTALKRLQ